MGKKDRETRTTIENILENSLPGQGLRTYFDGLPDKRLRRTISILSTIYPGKTTISDEEFSFILYMFSTTKFLEQESFCGFVRAVAVLDLTERQKLLLLDAIKRTIEVLCNTCTFELDALVVRVFEADELFRYMEFLAEKGSRPVLERVSDILRYENFSDSSIAVERVETLKQSVSKSIKRLSEAGHT